MKRSPACLAIAFIALIFFFIPSQAVCDEAKEVIATGLGGGKPAKARDDALNDALRKAVEQGVGAYVSSESLVENLILIEDRIYSESRGFVESYKILKEKRSDGITEVEISAIVKMAQLAKELAAIGIIISKKQNPRVMVITHSRETNSSFLGVEMEGNSSVGNQLEKILLQKGFRLIDAAQNMRNKALGELLRTGDSSSASKMARDSGAEILIEADVRRAFVDERQIMGRPMRFFTNEISLKALETDSARIIYSGYDSRPASGASALTPLEETTNKLAGEMVNAVLEQWRKDVYQAATLQLNIIGITFTELTPLIDKLREIRGMSDIQTRNFQDGNVALEVKFQGNINDLARRISSQHPQVLQVTGLKANTMDLKPAPR